MNGTVTAALVGGYQRGKSTLANALLGRNAAEKGRGLATTHANRTFSLTPRVQIVDTPGFDANEKDTEEALAGLEQAEVFVYVHESKALGTTCEGIFRTALETGKDIVFLLNCRNFEKWAPEENADIARTIESELANRGLAAHLLPLGGRQVVPINALWAAFGEGLLEPDGAEDQKDIRRIRNYAADDLALPGAASMPEETLRAEMLRRSGVPEIREWLVDLPVRRLQALLENPEQTLDRILGRFSAELLKCWTGEQESGD